MTLGNKVSIPQRRESMRERKGEIERERKREKELEKERERKKVFFFIKF